MYSLREPLYTCVFEACVQLIFLLTCSTGRRPTQLTGLHALLNDLRGHPNERRHQTGGGACNEGRQDMPPLRRRPLIYSLRSEVKSLLSSCVPAALRLRYLCSAQRSVMYHLVPRKCTE